VIESIKVLDEVSIVHEDVRYLYKLQKVLHKREDAKGRVKVVAGLRIAYWKNNRYKRNPPIMLAEELVTLLAKGIKKGLFDKSSLRELDKALSLSKNKPTD